MKVNGHLVKLMVHVQLELENLQKRTQKNLGRVFVDQVVEKMHTPVGLNFPGQKLQRNGIQSTLKILLTFPGKWEKVPGIGFNGEQKVSALIRDLQMVHNNKTLEC